MSDAFEPVKKINQSHEFSTWDIQALKPEEPVKPSEEELRIEEYERLKKEAIETGYAEGLLQAQEEINLKQAELTYWVGLLYNPIQLIDAQLTQELIQTVIWLCAHCIGVELSINPNQLQALLDELKTELPSVRGNKTLIMNPEDVQWIKKEINESLIPGLHEALVEDPLLNRGDFYIKSENSQLDGSLKTRLTTLFGKYIDGNL